MSDAFLPPKLKPGFLGLDTALSPEQQALYRPATLMRTTEWGLLTVTSLLSLFLFPPYFVTVLTIAFLNAGGLLWVTHLTERGRQRLIEFEREFRKGYELEEAGDREAAIDCYEKLIPKYQDHPAIAEVAFRRIVFLNSSKPAKAPKLVKKKPFKKKMRRGKA
jgi:hypothetical protein